ncbi:MAG: Decarbamoylnovobiocin carbamoyltransferase [Alphaproteobacteria bacterium MarineAlpha6_Bin4]|nr:MAG: Decarbamoylnovobiocin carbamoyltransferase [Alphaproteobacteria bacterium MarineAlpha6_Bin3]PPR38279.1 MAG: Decarbamoylnovobiocin carbamoyltransferase [Alphaproteobacteria bacterium MarineAlpha6_Bin4]
MNIIGISCFYHDSAAALIKDGNVISAVQEERFTRIKHDASFPINSIKYCLKSSNLKLSNIDAIVFYEKPFIKFERLLETYLQKVPFGFQSFKLAIPLWIKEKLFQRQLILRFLKSIDSSKSLKNKIFFTDHHHSHAASAFYPSSFKEAIVLTMDGVGEWATTTVYIGKKNTLELKKEINFPHSLGLLYSAFTYFLGFKVNDGEYKIMGLAPYGEPKYKNLIKNYLIDIKKDGSFKLNQKYFNYSTGLTMTNKNFSNLFNMEVRKETDKLSQKHMDIASSIQSVLEEVVLLLTKNLRSEYGIENLCLAGGVALNCVANGKILNKSYFKNLWIQPAAGDAGGALGAALAIYYEYFKKKRRINYKTDLMQNSYLGPSYSNSEIKKFLDKNKIKYKYKNEGELISITASLLAKGKILGWFQDKMEFGPRALGNRSIIADPRSDKMQKNLNLKIKFRESFRPFAPIVLKEKVSSWFNLSCDSPYMLLVSNIKDSKKIKIKENNYKGIKKLYLKRSIIPAVTHVDYSARIQTLTKENNLIYKLLKKFYKITKCPVLVNTSFNVKDEPIVCSYRDAYNCFTNTGLDALILGNYIIDNKKVKLN